MASNGQRSEDQPTGSDRPRSRRTSARALTTFALILAVLLLTAAPAGAQSLDEIAERAAEEGSYADPAAEVSAGALGDVVADARAEGSRFVAVALADDPPGSEALADRVLDVAGSGTVVVLTPEFLWYASDEYGQDRLDAAEEESRDEFSGDAAAGFAAFATALEDGTGGSGSGGGIGSTGVLLLLFVVGLPLVVFLLTRRRSRAVGASPEQAAASVAEARAELDRQVARVADGILELSDRVTVSGTDEAKAHFAEANATYAAVSQELPTLDTLAELEGAADRLDRARWQVEATRASLEGRPPPPPPVEGPSACFFDPDHGAGVERAEVRAGTTTRAVPVCRACADALARGEAPATRTISVGGQQVPAASAPRSYGGGGLGLPGLFDVLFGGGTVHQDWGGYGGYGYPRRRRRGYGGLLGGGGYGWGGGMGGFGGGIAGGTSRGGGFGGFGRSSGGGGRARGGARRSGGGGRARGGRRR